MKWKKLGRVFVPNGEFPWMRTHAAIPTPQLLGGDRVRFYFTSRDHRGYSQIAWAEVDMRKPTEVLALSSEPLLTPDKLGAFDDCGTMISCIVARPGEKDYYYYTGWHLTVTVPFNLSIGLAVPDGKGRLARMFEGPILSRTMHDPYLMASPCVLVEGGVWRVWYVSGTDWEMFEGKPRHYYHIKTADSKDGIHWNQTGTVAIDYLNKDEYAISRPCVVKDKDCYRMWFSSRGDKYRIRYAESPDGIRWNRKEGLAGIDVSAESWDSDMIEYPWVFDHGGKRYMLYNGNGYGLSGFGIAVLE